MAEAAHACSNRRRALIGSWVTLPTTSAIEIEQGGDENITINRGCRQGEAGRWAAQQWQEVARQRQEAAGQEVVRQRRRASRRWRWAAADSKTTARGSRASGGTTMATSGMTTTRGSRATGGTTMATGGMMTARSSRVSGGMTTVETKSHGTCVPSHSRAKSTQGRM